MRRKQVKMGSTIRTGLDRGRIAVRRASVDGIATKITTSRTTRGMKKRARRASVVPMAPTALPTTKTSTISPSRAITFASLPRAILYTSAPTMMHALAAMRRRLPMEPSATYCAPRDIMGRCARCARNTTALRKGHRGAKSAKAGRCIGKPWAWLRQLWRPYV